MKNKIIFIVVLCFLISCNDQNKTVKNTLTGDTVAVDSIKNESESSRVPIVLTLMFIES